MNATERLLSLIASLLAAREPVPRATIRSWFEDYSEVSDEAFDKKFERDKAELVNLGLPLRYVQGGDGVEAGYQVVREETYLPAIDFDPEEMTVVTIAGAGVLTQSEFPYHRDLERALDKLELQARPERVAGARGAARRVLLNHPIQQPGAEIAARLETISAAMSACKRLRMVYHTLYSGDLRDRTVDPYGMRCWRGRWALIGYCHERGEVRLFSLHRIREVAVQDGPAGEPDFEIPADFSVVDWQMQPAWRYKMHAPIAVRIEVDAERAWMVESQVGTAAGQAENGWKVFDLQVTNADGFVEWALRQGPNLRVVAPDEVRSRVIAALRGVVELYQGAAQ